jgi:hypothetical protein
MLMVRDETARILDGLSLADPIPIDAVEPVDQGRALDHDAEQGAATVAVEDGDGAPMGKDDLPRQA